MRPPRGLLAGAAVLAALVCATPSPADGDTASDVLLAQNVFFPYQAPSKALAAALVRDANSVYEHGERIKIALVYAEEDLGAVPSLFNRPGDYARFLGFELGLFYVGPLLVVMPAGFGMYDGGRSTAAEEAVLRSLDVAAARPDDLVRSAMAALDRLLATGALRSLDIKPPLVTAHPAFARRGKPVKLRFDVFDDSGWAKALVRVQAGNSLLAQLASPVGFKIGTRNVSVSWRVPKHLSSRHVRFCVIASDRAGNTSAPVCASFLRIS